MYFKTKKYNFFCEGTFPRNEQNMFTQTAFDSYSIISKFLNSLGKKAYKKCRLKLIFQTFFKGIICRYVVAKYPLFNLIFYF